MSGTRLSLMSRVCALHFPQCVAHLSDVWAHFLQSTWCYSQWALAYATSPARVFSGFPFTHPHPGLSWCPSSHTKPCQPFWASGSSELYGMYCSLWDLITRAHAQMLCYFLCFLSFGHYCALVMSRSQAMPYSSLSTPFSTFSLWPGDVLGVGDSDEWVYRHPVV